MSITEPEIETIPGLHAEINRLARELQAARQAERRNFNWAYALLLRLAVRQLADANAKRENERDWPAGQYWDELNSTSHSIFLHRARDEAGIPHDAFLDPIRDGTYDVTDLYEASNKWHEGGDDGGANA